MSITIRPAIEGDEPSSYELFLYHWGEPWTFEQYLERRARWAHRARFEFVAERDGKVVGWIESVASRQPDKHWLRLAVHPQERRKGVASKLLHHLRSSLEGVVSLKTEYKDNSDAAISFAQKSGFVRGNHTFESSLDLHAFDPSKWQSAVDRLHASGLRIATMADFVDSPESRYKFWELEHVTDHDIPGVDPDFLLDWSDAEKIIFGASHYDPAGEFLALDGDRFVALSGVGEPTPGSFYNQHTCVLREYRGRGLAIGLKVLALSYAKQKSGSECITNNDSNNEPMLAINRKLGYVPRPGWYEGTLDLA